MLAVSPGLLTVIVLLPWTYPSQNLLGILLATAIHAIGLYGLVLCSHTWAKLEVEEAIAAGVDRKASETLAQIRDEGRQRPEIDRLEVEYLPQNPSREKGILQVYKQVIRQARDREFPQVSLLADPLREECTGELYQIQSLQRLALHLGILGTFAGLILALGELAGSVEEILDTARFAPLFSALNVAFSTSLAGLQSAVLLGGLIMSVRKRQEAVLRTADASLTSFLLLARNALNRDDFLSEFSQVRRAVSALGEKMEHQNGELELQTNHIRQGLDRLGQIRADFNRMLSDLRLEQSRILKETREAYEFLSPKGLSEELGKHLDSASREASLKVEEAAAALAARFAPLEQMIDKMAGMIEQDLEAKQQRTLIQERGEAALDKACWSLVRALERIEGVSKQPSNGYGMEQLSSSVSELISEMRRERDGRLPHKSFFHRVRQLFRLDAPYSRPSS